MLFSTTVFEKSYSFVCCNPFLKPLKDLPDVLGLSEGLRLWNLAHSASITISNVLPAELAVLSIRGDICFVKLGQLACSYWSKGFSILMEGPSYDLASGLLLSLESEKSSLLLDSVKYYISKPRKLQYPTGRASQTSRMVLYFLYILPFWHFLSAFYLPHCSVHHRLLSFL